jgi:hypothetical protein
MNYIKKLDALHICRSASMYCFETNDPKGQAIADRIEDNIFILPEVDVEVKHGKWKLYSDGSGTCSVCGRHQKHIWDFDHWQNFCGHCGADLREENK